MSTKSYADLENLNHKGKLKSFGIFQICEPQEEPWKCKLVMHQQLDHLVVLASLVYSAPQKRNLGLPGMDSLALSGCSHMLVVETCNIKSIERKTFE
jgi:hypothetical protein